MPTYNVVTRRTVDEAFVVDAPDSTAAIAAALSAASSTPSREIAVTDVYLLIGGKTNVYICSYCNEASRKTEWGPGWNRCPNCASVGTAPPVTS